MLSQIHHAALNATEFDWYMKFFQNAFGMTIQKTAGEKPSRKVWFHEGIQLIECETAPVCGSVCDHLALAVEDIPGTAKRRWKAAVLRYLMALNGLNFQTGYAPWCPGEYDLTMERIL